MPTSLPRIDITRANPGWLAKCSACPFERYMSTRPGIDRVSHEHRQTCGRGQASARPVRLGDK